MTIQITEEEYERLIDRDSMLNALEKGGVDNWEWYCYSLEEYNKEKESKELEKKFKPIAKQIVDFICEDICSQMYEPSNKGAGFAVNDKAYNEYIKYICNILVEN